MPTTKFSKIQWGDGLTVTPDPDDPAVIRVDSGGGGSDGTDGVGVPPGGTGGQVLTKVSSTDFDTDWETPTGGGGGGAPTGAAGGALDGSYPNPGLAATVAGAGLTETSDVLSVNVDGSTLVVASDQVKVNTDGNAAHYLNGAGGWTAPTASVAHLDDVGDVTAPTPADEQVLAWDAGGSNWQPKTALLRRVFGAGWTGLTPSPTAASAVWKVPKVDGANVTFNVDRALLRLETPGTTTTTSVRVEKSAGGGAFSPTTVTTLNLSSAAYEATVTSSLGTVTSGDLLRAVFTATDSAAAGYLIALEGST